MSKCSRLESGKDIQGLFIEADEQEDIMLGDNTHCALLFDQIRDKVNHIMDGFKLFVQMFSAIIAGAVTLRLQFGPELSSEFSIAADALVFLVAAMTAAAILDNIRSWNALRQRVSEVAGVHESGAPIISHPDVYASFRVQGLMLIVVTITTIGFWIFNPLR